MLAIAGALVFTFLYNLLFYKVQIGIGAGVFIFLLHSYFYLTREKSSKYLSLGIVFSLISITFAFLVGLRANEVVSSINILTSIFFSFVALYFYKNMQLFNFQIPQFLLTPLLIARDSLSSLFDFFKSPPISKKENHKEIATAVIRGVGIAIPILVILAIILLRADPVFAKLTENFLGNFWERLIISLIVFSAVFTLGITQLKKTEQSLLNPDKKTLGRFYELLVVTTSIVTLLATWMKENYTSWEYKVSLIQSM
ncbi:hypothetical protein HYS91_04925 [Candidatus Daviesbacteria bacterium]|nr:hypothetical protein [Candidatus Daviesbacteria bacterium]